MSEIIISFVVVAVVVTWVLLRRQNAVRQAAKPPYEERMSLENSEAAQVTGAETRAVAQADENSLLTKDAYITPTANTAPARPDEPPQSKLHSREPDSVQIQEELPQPCPISAIIRMQVTPPPISPEVTFPATNETTIYEQNSAMREPEQIQPTSVPLNDANLSGEEVSVLSDSLVAKAKTHPLVSEAAFSGGNSHIQSAAEEQLGDLDTSLNRIVPIMPAASPPSSGEVESESHNEIQQSLGESELVLKAPTYHPPIPPAQKPRTSGTRQKKSLLVPRTESDLLLRVQLVFGHCGDVKTLSLVADKCEGMPSDIEVRDMHRKLHLTELSDDYYEPVTMMDAEKLLQQGIVWHGCSGERRWRWVLSGRELYVLAPGEEFGLHGFVSAPRLRLNGRHLVLAKANLRDKVWAILIAAGCATTKVSYDTVIGVPPGWVLFTDVTPTRAIPMREEQDITNILCPAHEIEPHFVGGIRIERNIWLARFPPRIYFTGKLGNEFRVAIDGQTAQPVSNGAFESPGWDTACEHRLCFGDRFETYSLCTMNEKWESWEAHDLGNGAAICGAATYRTDGSRFHQVHIPSTNRLLIGARPGEIFYCQSRYNVLSNTIIILVPFAPVWALPMDIVHANKRYARLVLLDSIEPVPFANKVNRNHNADRAFRQWVTAINNTGRKQLALAVESKEAKALWQRYSIVAKQLWRKMR